MQVRRRLLFVITTTFLLQPMEEWISTGQSMPFSKNAGKALRSGLPDNRGTAVL
jgi:hypothetical protein